MNSPVNGSLLLSVSSNGGAGFGVDNARIDPTPDARLNRLAEAAAIAIGGRLTTALHEVPIDALTDKSGIVIRLDQESP